VCLGLLGAGCWEDGVRTDAGVCTKFHVFHNTYYWSSYWILTTGLIMIRVPSCTDDAYFEVRTEFCKLVILCVVGGFKERTFMYGCEVVFSTSYALEAYLHVRTPVMQMCFQ
jgi:hypothetical protein